MRYWVSAVGFDHDGNDWETEPVALEMEGVVEFVGDDADAEVSLVSTEPFVSSPAPAGGFVTGLVLRLERDGEPFERLVMPEHMEII